MPHFFENQPGAYLPSLSFYLLSNNLLVRDAVFFYHNTITSFTLLRSNSDTQNHHALDPRM